MPSHLDCRAAVKRIDALFAIEREINGTPGLLLMRSTSTFGLSLITVLFRDGYEDYWVRQRLLERINQVTLPAGASASLDPVASRALWERSEELSGVRFPL